MMEWSKLLTRQRLSKKETEDAKSESGRTCFQKDYDRLVFSSPFRRLKDKTQVFSLSNNDYVRTRLIHSLEVSCVGRSLGTIVGSHIIERHKKELEDFQASDFGDIVAAACLAHDIGNPPFGHTGEDAISAAFKSWHNSEKNLGTEDFTDEQKKDLENFEGNAQGFRILTRLERFPTFGGMQLTCPTLAAFTKYPKVQYIPKEHLKGHIGKKSVTKYGFFQSEKDLFAEVAQTVGLLPRHDKFAWWARHPLVFLVEAADDICYRIVDLEDGHRMNYIPYNDTQTLLNNIAQLSNLNTSADTDREKIKRLRGEAINKLAIEMTDLFLEHEQDILAGTFDDDLISLSTNFNNLKAIQEKTREKVYLDARVLEIQVAGYEVIDKLFAHFVNVTLPTNEKNDFIKKKNELLKAMLPSKYSPADNESLYRKILKITDYISGMTDSFATNLFQQLKGISLS